MLLKWKKCFNRGCTIFHKIEYLPDAEFKMCIGITTDIDYNKLYAHLFIFKTIYRFISKHIIKKKLNLDHIG